jgi:hypothetical protein
LAHELAHLRRWDDVANFVQTWIEAILFYHPAVWWISRTVRQERENACDDMVVTLVGSGPLYARALVSFAELQMQSPTLAVGASGGKLLQRIRRLMTPSTLRPGVGPGWVVLGLICLTVIVTAAMIGCGAWRAVGRTTAPTITDVKTPHALSVQVLDAEGNPLPGATVCLVHAWDLFDADRDDESRGHVQISDRNGRAQFSFFSSDVEEQSFGVAACKPGLVLAATTLLQGEQQLTLRLVPGPDIRMKAIVAPWSEARGALSPSWDEYAKPAAGVWVQPNVISTDHGLLRLPDAVSRLFAVQTDAGGIATFKGLPARRVSWITYDDRYAVAGANGASFAPLLRLITPAGSIRGRVVLPGASLPGPVRIHVAGLGADAMFTSEADGNFSTGQLPSGDFWLSCGVGVMGRDSAVSKGVATMKFHLDKGQSLNLGEIELNAGGIVKGTVFAPEGWACPHIPIELIDKNMANTFAYLMTDAGGHYEARLLPGSYSVIAMQGTQRAEGQVEITEGKTAAMDIHVPNDERVRATVQVLDADARPLPRVILGVTYGGSAQGRTAFVTDSKGQATIIWQPNLQSDIKLDPVIFQDQVSDSLEQPLTPGESITVRLHRVPSTSIVGQVVEADTGRPISGADVALDGGADQPPFSTHPGNETITDQDGRYRFDAVPQGKVHFGVRAPGYWYSGTATTPVMAGKVQEIAPIRLAPMIHVTVQVVDEAGAPVAGVRLTSPWRFLPDDLVSDESGMIKIMVPRGASPVSVTLSPPSGRHLAFATLDTKKINIIKVKR